MLPALSRQSPTTHIVCAKSPSKRALANSGPFEISKNFLKKKKNKIFSIKNFLKTLKTKPKQTKLPFSKTPLLLIFKLT